MARGAAVALQPPRLSTHLTGSALAALLWSMASLRQELDVDIQQLELPSLSLRRLANAFWALTVMAFEPASLLQLQEECLRRCPQHLAQCGDPDALLTAAYCAASLGLSRLPQRLATKHRPRLWPLVTPEATKGQPRISKELPELLVIYKPPGWQVDTTERPKSTALLLDMLLLPLSPRHFLSFSGGVCELLKRLSVRTSTSKVACSCFQ